MLLSAYMRYDEIIKGNKILLRQLEIEDCKQGYVDWLNDAEVNKFIEPRWQVHTIESNKKYVQNIIDSNDAYIFAIVLNEKHIGNILIKNIHPIYKYAEMSYLIGEKEYWGKGIATEAINLVCDFAFNTLNLHRLQAVVYEDNIGSQKVLLKNGFVKEATYRKQCFVKPGDNYCDYYEYGLLKEEFK